jgi:hypothetical protein
MTYLSSIAVDAVSNLHAVRSFVDEHGLAVANAAHVLGGPAASGRFYIFAETLRDADQLTRSQRRQLVKLHELLTLQHVGDPDRIETQRFSEIHPELPIVDEICLLSDRLQELLTLISDQDRDGCSVFDGHLYKEVA